ncbi:MAG: hypothetical protein KJ674_00250 [Nanoarchaeota archaeon]|nr:hypothetical protein [Nanoarchaeota archaeon]
MAKTLTEYNIEQIKREEGSSFIDTSYQLIRKPKIKRSWFKNILKYSTIAVAITVAGVLGRDAFKKPNETVKIDLPVFQEKPLINTVINNLNVGGVLVRAEINSYENYLVRRGDNLSRIALSNYGVADRKTLKNLVKFNLENNSDPLTDSLKIDDRSFVEGEILDESDGIQGDRLYEGQMILIPKDVNVKLNLEDIVYNNNGFVLEDKNGILEENVTVLDYVKSSLSKDFKGAIRTIEIENENGVSLYDGQGNFKGAVLGVGLEGVTSDSLDRLKIQSLLDAPEFMKTYFGNNDYIVDLNTINHDLDNIVDVYNVGGITALRNEGYKGNDAYEAVHLARNNGDVVKGSMRLIKESKTSFEDLRDICSTYVCSDTNDIAIKKIEEDLGYQISKGTMYRLVDLYQKEIGLDCTIRKSKLNIG